MMKNLAHAIAIIIGVGAATCAARDIPIPAKQADWANWDRVHFDHALLDGVLIDHVDASGLVDYAAIRTDPRFDEYLYRLSRTDPAKLVDNHARLAFWINAYNAFVIQGVLEALPSDRSQWSTFSVLAVSEPGPAKQGNAFFRRFKFVVGGRRYALDEIEHGVLLQRDEWTRRKRRRYASIGAGTPDPRIHFALVCAAKGCVKLRRGAYTADKVNEQLDAAVREFTRETAHFWVDAANHTIHLTKLLDWYGKDLTNKTFEPHAKSVPAFLAKYVSNAKLARALRDDQWHIEWILYDWTLNVQP